jgi:DNA-binding transcriptional MerR regulator
MQETKKVYYSISEVCTKTGLEPHVLRYWETEFAQLRPKKNRAGNRAYRVKDIDVVRYIKHLLYQEQYTIPGAKKKLTETKDFDIPMQMQLLLPATPPPGQTVQVQVQPMQDLLKQEIIADLKNVLRILK